MSLSFILTCPETRQKLCIGQGHHAPEPPHAPEMTVLFSGEPETMNKLYWFLCATQGKSLVLAVEDYGQHVDGWTDFT